MTGWQPIETAPKDGTKIDLWVTETWSGGTGGMRVCNAWWEKGKWLRKIEEGDYAGENDEIEDRRTNYNAIVTHWMLLPEPPSCPK